MLHGLIIVEEPPDGMIKEFRQLLRTGLTDLVEDWHRKIMPHHFTAQAQRTYNYAARTIGYLRQKRKKHPTAGPLEFSGKSRHQLTRTIRIRGTHRRMQGVMTAPGYFYMTPPNHPNKPEELMTVTNKEGWAMAQRLKERVTGQLDKVRKSRQIYR